MAERRIHLRINDRTHEGETAPTFWVTACGIRASVMDGRVLGTARREWCDSERTDRWQRDRRACLRCLRAEREGNASV